jgi:hypothetical protein
LKIHGECGIERADLEGMILNAADAYKTVWTKIRPEIVARRVSSFFTLDCSMSRWDRGAYVDDLDSDGDDTPDDYDLSATLQYVGKAESFIAGITKIDVDGWSYGIPRGDIFEETIVVESSKARGA